MNLATIHVTNHESSFITFHSFLAFLHFISIKTFQTLFAIVLDSFTSPTNIVISSMGNTTNSSGTCSSVSTMRNHPIAIFSPRPTCVSGFLATDSALSSGESRHAGPLSSSITIYLRRNVSSSPTSSVWAAYRGRSK